MSDTDELQQAARISLMKVLGHLSVQERQFIQQRFDVVLSDPPTSDELEALTKIPIEQIAAVERDAIARMQHP